MKTTLIASVALMICAASVRADIINPYVFGVGGVPPYSYVELNATDTDPSATFTVDAGLDNNYSAPGQMDISLYYPVNATITDSDGNTMSVTVDQNGNTVFGPNVPPGAAPYTSLDYTASVASVNPVAALASNGTGLIAVGVSFCAFSWMMWTLTRKMHPGT